jgi:hypothetical protein
MYREKRTYRRITVDLPAKVDPGIGLPLRDCRVLDISEQGARLAVDNAEQMPDEFTILLTPAGVPCRRCRMIWREHGHVGVEFDRAISPAVWQ